MFGMTLEEASGPPIAVWPDNWQAFKLFSSISTQWRAGMSGATGLDYNPLFHRMDRMKLTDPEYEELFSDVQTMEDEALKVMRVNSK